MVYPAAGSENGQRLFTSLRDGFCSEGFFISGTQLEHNINRHEKGCMMTDIRFKGLTSSQAQELQKRYGKNEPVAVEKETLLHKIFSVLTEPMFLLLLGAAVIYFILGEPKDASIMLIFVVAVISIEIVQEWKTDKTLRALKDLSAPHVCVIRDGKEQIIPSADLVPNDIMILSEGVKIPADGFILQASDLRVDESSLTGEAEPVFKVEKGQDNSSDYWRKDYCYAGTLILQGTGFVQVEKTGALTEYGKIGKHIAEAPERPTPLEKQTAKLVGTCTLIAGGFFTLVVLFTFFSIEHLELKSRIISSVLSGITLAMAMIPEEFPVVLTVFLSMGAWRLARKKALIRHLPSVETLGAVSVLCVDKTGTITMNKMSVAQTVPHNISESDLLEIMGFACETQTYDPMEAAMLAHCEKRGVSKQHVFSGRLIKEYAFTDDLKMMGHVWEHDNEIIIASKGSPEKIMTLCDLTPEQKAGISERLTSLSQAGLRVIGVAYAKAGNEKEIPERLTDCRLTFAGLVGLSDPPREGVKENIGICTKAGMRVVMITGDNGVTATAIAKAVGIPNCENVLTGDELNKLSDDDLKERVKTVNLFARVIPEHKMRIVKALQENGEIVAMTGDGVNDAPALKHANIGIAMGQRGSDVSREAADLILTNDNFLTIVETVHDGRRIYDNIKKASGYIFTIHIPIAFAALIAPLLGIAPADLLLLPVHVVLLELVIDPTCSIVLERQPAETDIMEKPPRRPNESILPTGFLLRHILQGIIVFAASFGIYFYYLKQTDNAVLARSVGLTVILLANLMLVQVNASVKDFAFTCLKKLLSDRVMQAINVLTLIGLGVILYSPLAEHLRLKALSPNQFLSAFGIAFVSVYWFELVKLYNKIFYKKQNDSAL